MERAISWTGAARVGGSVAVLVDGDNIPARLAPRIAEVAAKCGPPGPQRVYGNARHLAEWEQATAFHLIHAAAVKNAADMVLAMDAVELVHAGLRSFVLASSDGDFAYLAHRLRERGAEVTGLGGPLAPARFRLACDRFVELPMQNDGPPRPAPLAVVPPVPAPAAPPPSAKAAPGLEAQVVALLTSHQDGLPITHLNGARSLLGNVRIGDLPEKTWRGWLEKRPSLFRLDPKGPTARVRLSTAERAGRG